MRPYRVLLAILLITLGASAYADPPGRVARINNVEGPVSFAPAEAPDDWTQAVLNRPLTAGDRLWADSAGRAELHVGSTAMRLAALTSVDILNLDDETLQLRLAQGAVNVRVRDLAPNETIEIATPAGAVLLRQPGSYRISTDPQSGESRVLVNFGQAEVVTPTQTVTVPSSQLAVVSPQAGIAFEVAAYASADEFDRWSADRDRREDRVTSTRYVSRDMTGYEDLDQYGSWQTLPEYGAVWTPTRVASGWAPYRDGHWAWVSPWGWTWVDDAPWGFAPFHYGRWVYASERWAWAPGPVVRRPVYAPALVAFMGGAGFSMSVTSGPAVGWFPLGWHEPYRPWYRASETHVRNVNVTNVTNITNIRYVNRDRPGAVTVVSQQAFVSARPVAQSRVNMPRSELARAEVIRDRSPAEPVRASLAAERAGRRPPAQAFSREVVSVTAPATPAARDVPAFRDRGASATHSAESEPRVRVLNRERAERGAPGRNEPRSAQGGPTVQGAPVPPRAQNAPGAGATSAPRAPREERRAAPPRETPPAGATPATVPPRAQAARVPPPQAERERPAANVERRAAPRADERRAAPERRAPRAEERSAAGGAQPEARARAAERPATRSESRPVVRHPEDQRPPRREEPARARPAPSQQGEGATRSAAPQHELRFSERGSGAHYGHAPPPRHAEGSQR